MADLFTTNSGEPNSFYQNGGERKIVTRGFSIILCGARGTMGISASGTVLFENQNGAKVVDRCQVVMAVLCET